MAAASPQEAAAVTIDPRSEECRQKLLAVLEDDWCREVAGSCVISKVEENENYGASGASAVLVRSVICMCPANDGSRRNKKLELTYRHDWGDHGHNEWNDKKVTCIFAGGEELTLFRSSEHVGSSDCSTALNDLVKLTGAEACGVPMNQFLALIGNMVGVTLRSR